MGKTTPEPIMPELTSLRTKLVVQIDTDMKIRDAADKRIKRMKSCSRLSGVP